MTAKDVNSTLNKGKDSKGILARFLLTSISFISLLINIMLANELSAALCATASIALSLYLIVLTRHNWPLVIIFMFIGLCCYSFCIVNYFNVNISSPYLQLKNSEISIYGISITLLFLLILTLCLPGNIGRFPKGGFHLEHSQRNTAISIICGILVIAFGILGIGEAYESGSRIRITSIYEYTIILYMLGLFFSGGEKKTLWFLTIVLAFRIVIDFSLGGRVTSMELTTAWFLVLFSHRIPYEKAIPVIVLAFIVMLSVGELRGDAFTLDAVRQGIADFVEAGFSWDGAYSAYYTSLTFLPLEEISSFQERFEYFGSFLLSILLGNDVSGSNLTLVAREYMWNMGGGYFPYFFHYYLGWFGVILFSLLLGLWLRQIATMGNKKNNSNFSLLCAIWVSSMVYRWFQYNPMVLIRGLFFLSCLYLIFYIYNKSNEKKLIKKDIKDV